MDSLMDLQTRIEARRQYPKDLGYPPTAVSEKGMGAWRQGYEAAIDDVLQLLKETALDRDLTDHTPWAV